MRRTFGTVILLILALFFLLTAWQSGTDPAGFAQQLGLSITNPGGYNEIRSQYGGCFLFASVACLAALGGRVSRRSAFVVATVIFGGLFVGRLVSLWADGGISGYGALIRALYVIDALGLTLTVTAMLLDSRNGDAKVVGVG
ncbi:MAG TPA: DUF4345 family protein [Steroidobacteraceae bacterium]|nr:DUF4345 family protein [Steroidobacteraceae bacterium]